MIISMSEGSLHDLGISLENLPIHEQLPHRKAIYLALLIVVNVLKAELLFVLILTKII